MMEILLEASNNTRKFKCPYCNNRYTRIDMPTHIDEKHSEMIPKGITPLQITFNTVNKKKDFNGRCTECGGPTKWNENKGRYDRQCSEKCKKHYVDYMKNNMKNKYGKEHLLDDIEYQNNTMLKGRSIAGKYTWSDGTKKDYVGSYEKKALEFMDTVMKINSEDLITPGPTIEYEWNGEKHQWITDMYYIPYNLCFDIKDGGSNPNNREMVEYREKQDAKEAAIAAQKQYNYIRLTDNDFSQLMSIFFELKMSMGIQDKNEKIIRINEEVALSMCAIPPTDYRGGYIIPYMMKNTFNIGYAYTDNQDLVNNIHIINTNGKKEKKSRDEFLNMVKDYHIFKHKSNVIENTSLDIEDTYSIDEYYYELTGRHLLDEKQLFLDEEFIMISKLEDRLTANTNVIKATLESTKKNTDGMNVDINGWYVYNESTCLRTKSYDRLEDIPQEELDIIKDGIQL